MHFLRDVIPTKSKLHFNYLVGDILQEKRCIFVAKNETANHEYYRII